MESESVLTYPMFGAIESTEANLEDISLGHVELPPNMERVSENLDIDLMTVKILTINSTLKVLVNVMDAIEQEKAQIKIVQEEFHLLKKLKDEFIPIIKEKIGERFDNVLEDAALIAFSLSKSTLSYFGRDNTDSTNKDLNDLVILVERFKNLLS